MSEVNIYTDGACKGNPGPGGWGALLTLGEVEKELFGGEKLTTNNRMELTGAIKGLQALTKPCSVVLTTDSQYVIKGISEWMPNWKLKGWKTSKKQPVLNVDLWQELDRAIQGHTIKWVWVKGHAGHPGNERADELANKGVFSATQS
jgi:ribonuclease HI